MGVCKDEATIVYMEGGNEILVETAALFVSNTNYLALRFKSCYRQVADVRKGRYGIQANVQFEGK